MRSCLLNSSKHGSSGVRSCRRSTMAPGSLESLTINSRLQTATEQVHDATRGWTGETGQPYQQQTSPDGNWFAWTSSHRWACKVSVDGMDELSFGIIYTSESPVCKLEQVEL